MLGCVYLILALLLGREIAGNLLSCQKIKEKGTYAKMARGSLVRYMAEHQIENPEEIKQFDELGYKYKEEYSNSTKYCYLIH